MDFEQIKKWTLEDLVRELERGNFHHVNCCCDNDPTKCWSHVANTHFAELVFKESQYVKYANIEDLLYKIYKLTGVALEFVVYKDTYRLYADNKRKKLLFLSPTTLHKRVLYNVLLDFAERLKVKPKYNSKGNKKS